MHLMRRIGFMGLGIALAGCFSETPVFAGDKPADGSEVLDEAKRVGRDVASFRHAAETLLPRHGWRADTQG